jgi:putative flippase GtrA
VAVIFGILYLCLSGKTVFSLLPSNAISKAFATVSTFIFLNHYAWCGFFHTKYADRELKEMLPYFLLCVAMSVVATWILTTLTNLLLKKIKEKKKQKAKTLTATV